MLENILQRIVYLLSVIWSCGDVCYCIYVGFIGRCLP